MKTYAVVLVAGPQKQPLHQRDMHVNGGVLHNNLSDAIAAAQAAAKASPGWKYTVFESYATYEGIIAVQDDLPKAAAA